MKRPDFSRVKLSELFSLKDTPASFQADLWKKAFSASMVFCALSAGLSAYVGANQDEGKKFDLHDDARTYVEHAVFANPAVDKEKLQVNAIRLADTAERNRLAGLLSLTLVSGIGAGYSYKKLKTAQGKLTP